ncbi:hypothetical protein Tco_0839920 [Tanacetum coccineum]|uniref:Uncharacterized protein n=1 Tax=Tanacetum coccineum TaxID=301880 RepID=A0ABQ5AVV4_9ASTR
MQAEEQEKLSIEEKSKLFVQLLEARKKHFAKLFDKAMKKVNTFVDTDTELVEEEDKESEELKQCLEIILDDVDDVTIDATPLSTKSLTIIDYKIYKEGKKSYFQIIRADGLSAFLTLSFLAQTDLGKNSGDSALKLDLQEAYSLVLGSIITGLSIDSSDSTLELDSQESRSLVLGSESLVWEVLIRASRLKKVMADKGKKSSMETFAPNDKAYYYSGITSITVNEKNAYELKGKFLDDLHNNAFSGTNRKDAVEHIEYYLKIIDPIKLPNVDHDKLRIVVFPISLAGGALWDYWKMRGDEIEVSDDESSDLEEY